MENPAEKKRSRRIYVLWGIALTLLVSTAVLCWTVVVPVWQTHEVLRACGEIPAQPALRRKVPSGVTVNPTAKLTVAEAIEQLGGPKRAARRLSRHLRMPSRIATEQTKRNALCLLAECKYYGTDALIRVCVEDHSRVALMQLSDLGGYAIDALPALEKIRDGKTSGEREDWDKAIMKIRSSVGIGLFSMEFDVSGPRGDSPGGLHATSITDSELAPERLFSEGARKPSVALPVGAPVALVGLLEEEAVHGDYFTLGAWSIKGNELLLTIRCRRWQEQDAVPRHPVYFAVRLPDLPPRRYRATVKVVEHVLLDNRVVKPLPESEFRFKPLKCEFEIAEAK